jgi:hypothetical protein
MSKQIFLVLLIVFMGHMTLKCEAFGNSNLSIPKIGTAFFDNPLSLNKKPWGLSHQWTFGTSFMHALNYRWWWLMDTNFAIGALSNKEQSSLSAFMGGAGLRYTFFQDDFRPFVGITVHYVHFLGANTRELPLNMGLPIFVGLKPSGGLEAFFASELSVLGEVAYGLYMNINEPFRHIYYLNLSLAFYF